MTISAGWVSTPSTSRKQKTTCTQLRGCIPQLEYLPLWPGLLRTADEKELFSNKELKDFLWQTMIDTETGANKLKGMLPAKTVVGHKTGSSDRNADSMKTADNDAGLVILPDGRKYYIATFIMDSYETDEDNADIIARISRMVYDAMR